MPNPPLIELFWRLREAGLPLTLEQYDWATRGLLQALDRGLDISNQSAVLHLYRTVWVKSRREKQIFDETVREILDEIRSEIRPIPDKPAKPEPDSTDEASPFGEFIDTEPETPTPDTPTEPEPTPPIPQVARAIPRRRTPAPPDTDYFPATRQQMQQEWQQLQSPTYITRRKLDITATVRDIARQGFFLAPVWQRQPLKPRIVMLVDSSASMTPFSPLTRQLLATWQKAGFNSRDIYYFRNCPHQDSSLSFSLYHDAQCWQRVEPYQWQTAQAAVIFSDAGAARGRYVEERVEATDEFLETLLIRGKRVAWLNPLPSARWQQTTAAEIAEFSREVNPAMQMFGLEALPQMVRWLTSKDKTRAVETPFTETKSAVAGSNQSAQADLASVGANSIRQPEPDNWWTPVGQIELFRQRFGDAHLCLAQHAAFPLALTPDLLYGLWHKFCRGENISENIPWYAVADILLSSLCQSADTELYEMPNEIRNELLRQYRQRLGDEGLQALSEYLLGYVEQQLQSEKDSRQIPPLAQAQQWTALAYTQPTQAAKQLAAALQRAYADENRAQVVRLAAVVETLAEVLKEKAYEPLLMVARGYAAGARGDVAGVQQEAQWLKERKVPALLEGVLLPLPGERIPAPVLQPFEFEVVTVEVRQTGRIRKRTEVVKHKRRERGQFFREGLGNGVGLEMVAIPGGRFGMGTDEEEVERLCKKYKVDYFRWELPQHEVTVPPFFMGKYPVTQAQWREVAKLPKVNRDLKPEPSHFTGELPKEFLVTGAARSDRPVEQVSWYDAKEFCDRLSLATGREYRLPSEAEWEYACRAGTTTPFHFGETITAELANYDGNYTFAQEPKGVYREQTTPVGSFPANAWGLHDLHGNVWEWCADNWHENYKDAPSDGSIWLSSDGSSSMKLLRGGSWFNFPWSCRCALRFRNDVDYWGSFIGFRVACRLAARTF